MALRWGSGGDEIRTVFPETSSGWQTREWWHQLDLKVYACALLEIVAKKWLDLSKRFLKRMKKIKALLCKNVFKMEGDDIQVKHILLSALVLMFLFGLFKQELQLIFASLSLILLAFGILSKSYSKVLQTAGVIAFFHLIIFPNIYLYYAKNVPLSIRFNDEIFKEEKMALKSYLTDEIHQLENDSTFLSYVSQYKEHLNFPFTELISNEELIVKDIVLLPDLLEVKRRPIGGGGGGIVPVETITVRAVINNKEQFYSMESRRLSYRFNLISDLVDYNKKSTDLELERVRRNLLALEQKSDIWSYDNLINYSVKIFLFDSPMTPFKGSVNLVYMLHLSLLTVFVSKFLHYVNK